MRQQRLLQPLRRTEKKLRRPGSVSLAPEGPDLPFTWAENQVEVVTLEGRSYALVVFE